MGGLIPRIRKPERSARFGEESFRSRRFGAFGADEATLFTTKEPLELGGKSIPADSYTLFMLPHNEKSATLIVNKQVGQSGIE